MIPTEELLQSLGFPVNRSDTIDALRLPRAHPIPSQVHRYRNWARQVISPAMPLNANWCSNSSRWWYTNIVRFQQPVRSCRQLCSAPPPSFLGQSPPLRALRQRTTRHGKAPLMPSIETRRPFALRMPRRRKPSPLRCLRPQMSSASRQLWPLRWSRHCGCRRVGRRMWCAAARRVMQRETW